MHIKGNHEKLKGKWKLLIIVTLYNSPHRFNKLKQIIVCNGNSLSKNLKQLERNGIVEKPKSLHEKYRLTCDGNKIARLVTELTEVLNNLPH